jgi:hypothetical protein
MRTRADASPGAADPQAPAGADAQQLAAEAEAPYRESFGMQPQDGAHLLAESILFRRGSHTCDVGSQANDATRCESAGAPERRSARGQGPGDRPGRPRHPQVRRRLPREPGAGDPAVPGDGGPGERSAAGWLEAEAGNTL